MLPETRRIFWLAPLAVMAFLLRFGAMWFLQRRVPSERFDRHGFGLLGDFVFLCALALPLAVLLWWILRRRRPWRGFFAAASTPGRTALSVVLLLLIGAPTLGHVAALVSLPLSESWPALVSALVWWVICAGLRGLAVARP